MSKDMKLQSEQFLQLGSMGKFLIVCRIQLKFCFWLHKKHWHTSWQFQLEIRSNKKVITRNHFTNLFEMNSRWCLIYYRWKLLWMNSWTVHGALYIFYDTKQIKLIKYTLWLFVYLSLTLNLPIKTMDH